MVYLCFKHGFLSLERNLRARAGLIIWHTEHFHGGPMYFWADGPARMTHFDSFSLLTQDFPIKSLNVTGKSFVVQKWQEVGAEKTKRKKF